MKILVNALSTCVLLITVSFSVAINTRSTVVIPKPGINPRLSPYVAQFKAILDAKCKFNTVWPALNAALGHATEVGEWYDDEVVGWCLKMPKSALIIMIDERKFSRMTPLEREELMFHELGHCILDKDHNKARNTAKEPVSIMHPYTISESIYSRRHDYYVEELFSNIDCLKFNVRR